MQEYDLSGIIKSLVFPTIKFPQESVSVIYPPLNWFERRGLFRIKSESHYVITRYSPHTTLTPESMILVGQALQQAGIRAIYPFWVDKNIAISRFISGQRLVHALVLSEPGTQEYSDLSYIGSELIDRARAVETCLRSNNQWPSEVELDVNSTNIIIDYKGNGFLIDFLSGEVRY